MTARDSLSTETQDNGDIITFIFESADKNGYNNFEFGE